jgi:hypothetical protein
MTKYVFVLFSITALLLASNDFPAVAQKTYSYSPESLFLSSYRFVTLDKGFEVKRENPEIGLIKFEYSEGAIEDDSASIEIIRNAAGRGKHRLRVQIPSASEATAIVFLNALGDKIEKDFKGPSMDEKIFDLSYDKITSSIYRYLEIEGEFTVKDFDREKGIIRFIRKDTPGFKTAWCEIFKVPQGGHKVRLKIPSLSSGTLRTYLNGIEQKLKADYSGNS